jgi:hypothetical protein
VYKLSCSLAYVMYMIIDASFFAFLFLSFSVRSCGYTRDHNLLFMRFIHSSMALQPFIGPWPLLHFRNLFYTDGRTACTSDQPVARPLPTHRTTQTSMP